MSGAGSVTFDYSTWAAQFPELAPSVNAAQAQMYFNFAVLYLDNGPCSLVTNLPVRALILNMITAHISALLAPINGEPPSPLVGRISAATQGSINVAVEMPETLSGAWWNQTKYGALAWQALAPYRTALYVAPPQIPLAAQSLGGFGFRTMPFNGGFPWPR